MAQKKLLTNGNVFKRTDARWGGTVWYMDARLYHMAVLLLSGGLTKLFFLSIIEKIQPLISDDGEIGDLRSLGICTIVMRLRNK